MSHTKIGCEVIIRKGDTILLGKRGKAAFGTGTWALPGGHLELQERLVDALPENFFMPHKGIILNYLAQRLYLM
jgi:hypothetical protein